MSEWFQLKVTKSNPTNVGMVPTQGHQKQYAKWRIGSNSRPPLQWKYRHSTEGICECGLVAQSEVSTTNKIGTPRIELWAETLLSFRKLLGVAARIHTNINLWLHH